MSKKNITYQDFDSVIEKGDVFETSERGNNLIVLIKKWNDYIEVYDSKKILSVKKFPTDGFNDVKLINIELSELTFSPGQKAVFLYLDNSKVENIKIEDKYHTLQKIIIEGKFTGKLTSKIGRIDFDNFHFQNDENTSMHIVNLEITNFYISRTINLSEKIQIFGCKIHNFIIGGSDLGKMIFMHNTIKNFYISGVVIFKTLFLSNKIGKVHNIIKGIDGYPPKVVLNNIVMADVSRQLKISFDNSKDYLNANRFYRDEMMYILKSKLFLSPFLLLHLGVSYFGTSWALAGIFIFSLGVCKALITTPIMLQEYICSGKLYPILEIVINNINPYLNFQNLTNGMNPIELLYLILLSYGIYQFVLSIRRISRR